MQIRFVMVPGGHCNNEWKKISTCWNSGLWKNVKVWVLFKGDSWWHTVSCSSYSRKCTKFCNFFIPLLHSSYDYIVPLIMFFFFSPERWVYLIIAFKDQANSTPFLNHLCFGNALKIQQIKRLKYFLMNDQKKVYIFKTIKGIILKELLDSFKNSSNVTVFILHAFLCLLLFYTEMWQSIFLMKRFQ